MKINYITGPAGCGKTRYLDELEKQALGKGLQVLRTHPGHLQKDVRQALSAVRDNVVVVLVDDDAFHDYLWPGRAQVFIAKQGERNTWGGVQ